MPLRIETSSVVLRAPEPTDLAAIQQAGQDPEVVLGYGERVERRLFTAAEAQERLDWLSDRDWAWIIDIDGTAVGHIGLHEFGEGSRSAFMGMGLYRAELLGRGIGTAALTALIDWASGPPLSLQAMHLRVAEYNARAIACYRKCGFVEVAREEAAFELDGIPRADLRMTRRLPEQPRRGA